MKDNDTNLVAKALICSILAALVLSGIVIFARLKLNPEQHKDNQQQTSCVVEK